MEHDNSSLPPLNKKYPQRKSKSTKFLIDKRPSKTNVRAVVKPTKNYEVVYVNDESLSIIASDVHANITTTISQTSKVGRKRKRRNVLINKSTKSPKTIEANDKWEERKCPKWNVVKFV